MLNYKFLLTTVLYFRNSYKCKIISKEFDIL